MPVATTIFIAIHPRNSVRRCHWNYLITAWTAIWFSGTRASYFANNKITIGMFFNSLI
jgi:hypothetical protein